MAPAQIPVLLTQKPSTENGIYRATILFLAWIPGFRGVCEASEGSNLVLNNCVLQAFNVVLNHCVSLGGGEAAPALVPGRGLPVQGLHRAAL